jgi:hypothetical protein
MIVESVNYANTYLLNDLGQNSIECGVILFQNTVKDKQFFIPTTNANLQKCERLTVIFLAYRPCANWNSSTKSLLVFIFVCICQ